MSSILYINEPETPEEYYQYGMHYKKKKKYHLMIGYFKTAGVHEESLNELYEYKYRKYRWLYNTDMDFPINDLEKFDSDRTITNIIKFRLYTSKPCIIKYWCEIGMKRNIPVAFFGIGRCYHCENNVKQAMKYYLLAKDYPLALRTIGSIYYSCKNYTEALKYYEQVVNDIEIYNIFICYLKLNKYDLAYRYAVKFNMINLLFIKLYDLNKTEHYLFKHIGIYKSMCEYINNTLRFKIHINSTTYNELIKNYNKHMKHDPDESDRLNKETVSKLFIQINC